MSNLYKARLGRYVVRCRLFALLSCVSATSALYNENQSANNSRHRTTRPRRTLQVWCKKNSRFLGDIADRNRRNRRQDLNCLPGSCMWSNGKR